MCGVFNMENLNISVAHLNAYIDVLINRCFSILPLFEENGQCDLLQKNVNNLLYHVDGFFLLNNYNSNITIEIISYINELKYSSEHHQVRSCVLKACSLLSKLKVVVE